MQLRYKRPARVSPPYNGLPWGNVKLVVGDVPNVIAIRFVKQQDTKHDVSTTLAFCLSATHICRVKHGLDHPEDVADVFKRWSFRVPHETDTHHVWTVSQCPSHGHQPTTGLLQSTHTDGAYHPHKIGHFRDVLPSQSLGSVLKTEANTTKANTCIRNKICYNIKSTQKQKKRKKFNKNRFDRLLRPPV